MSVEGTRASRRFRFPGATVAGSIANRFLAAAVWSLIAAVTLVPWPVSGQTNSTGEVITAQLPAQVQDTNTLEILRVCQQLQEQLRTMRLAMEVSRAENKETAAQSAEALSNAFQVMEHAFTAQRTRDLEAMAASNRVTLTVAGVFAAVGFLTMVLVGYFQWRMSKELTEITSALPVLLGLGPGPRPHALPMPTAAPEHPKAPVLAHGEAGDGERGHERRSGGVSNDRSGLRVLEGTEPAAPMPKGRVQPTLAGRGGAGAAERRFIPSPLASLRTRRVRALRAAVIVGVICATILALLFCAVTWGAPGLGLLQDWLKR